MNTKESSRSFLLTTDNNVKKSDNWKIWKIGRKLMKIGRKQGIGYN